MLTQPPKPERTYLVDLFQVWSMTSHSPLGLGTHRQRAIIGRARDFYYKWRDESHDRNTFKKAGVATEAEIREFLSCFSRLSHWRTYEAQAKAAGSFYRGTFCTPFPKEQPT